MADPLTKQEIFNRVWQHFIVEDQPFGFDSNAGKCEYLTVSGARCAVGILMSPQLARIARGAVAQVFARYSTPMAQNGLYAMHHEDFLKYLQSHHDFCAKRDDKEEFESCLRTIAAKYELEIPA